MCQSVLFRLKPCDPALPILCGRKARPAISALSRTIATRKISASRKPIFDVSLCLAWVVAESGATPIFTAGILAIRFTRKRKLRFDIVSAYRCAGSAYKECTQAFDIQLSRFQTSLHFPIGHFLWIFQKFFCFLLAGEKQLLLIRTKSAIL